MPYVSGGTAAFIDAAIALSKFVVMVEQNDDQKYRSSHDFTIRAILCMSRKTGWLQHRRASAVSGKEEDDDDSTRKTTSTTKTTTTTRNKEGNRTEHH